MSIVDERWRGLINSGYCCIDIVSNVVLCSWINLNRGKQLNTRGNIRMLNIEPLKKIVTKLSKTFDKCRTNSRQTNVGAINFNLLAKTVDLDSLHKWTEWFHVRGKETFCKSKHPLDIVFSLVQTVLSRQTNVGAINFNSQISVICTIVAHFSSLRILWPNANDFTTIFVYLLKKRSQYFPSSKQFISKNRCNLSMIWIRSINEPDDFMSEEKKRFVDQSTHWKLYAH